MGSYWDHGKEHGNYYLGLRVHFSKAPQHWQPVASVDASRMRKEPLQLPQREPFVLLYHGLYWDTGRGSGDYYLGFLLGFILGIYWDNGKENGNYYLEFKV